MVTNFSVKIGEIGLFTFIHHPGILKRITVSYFWFQMVYLRWSGCISRHLV